MDAWSSFAALLFLFPPFAIVIAACVVKLFVLLQERTITWGRAFLYGLGFNVAAIVLYSYFLYEPYGQQ
jgi:hypothetical protein